ncbi:hypothetical protein PINS_up000372 [Pythium insidiosum]|nr:hypothetical protein PINS_up000372 [Pythium insidiosum]
MGVAHALEVLHALHHAAPWSSSPSDATGLSATLALPHPHLQQRLQQTLRGVLLLAVAGVVLPFAVLCLVLPTTTFEFPGLMWFAIVTALLIGCSVTHLFLRYVMLPNSTHGAGTSVFREPGAVGALGWAQVVICVLVEVTARLYQEPQLLVLLTLSLFHSWLWKSAAFYLLVSDDAATTIAEHFSVFVFLGGVVSFTSFFWLERRLAEDPFVLDPRSVLEMAVLRSAVHALRRGVLVWFLARVLLVLTQSDSISVFSLRFHRAFFHVSTSAIESFVLLSCAAVFRILLFRANIKALEQSAHTGQLWDSAGSNQAGDAFANTLFGEALAVDNGSTTPLGQQYINALKKRADGAKTQIASRKVCGASLASEHVDCLEKLFKFDNVSVASKFNPSCRKQLFSSEDRWKSFVGASTAVIDSFALTLRLLNSIPERRNSGQEDQVAMLEKSVRNLAQFLILNAKTHPLLILDAHPHLSNLRISSNNFKSKIKYYFESRIQFAVRRFVMEEATHRVFAYAKAVNSCQRVLCHLVSVSRAEDASGNAQHAVPAILTSLVECRATLEAYIDSASKSGNSAGVYPKEAQALARGIDKGIYRITDAFYMELSVFTFPASTKKAIEGYVNFSK